MHKKSLYGGQVVPQNSLINVKHRLLEHCAENTPTQHCPHCENMAKNFLYLESLIRSNFNPKMPCKLCFSSLKYLQFVNKSIMQVFGNCDAIVNAAKAFLGPLKDDVVDKADTSTTKKRVELVKKTKRLKPNNLAEKSTKRQDGGSSAKIPKIRQRVAVKTMNGAKTIKMKPVTNLRENRVKKKIKESQRV